MAESEVLTGVKSGWNTFGPNPNGMAIFTEDGHFMIINTRADLPKFGSNNRMQGASDENKAVVQGSIGLFGTYSVDGKVIKLKIADSTFVTWKRIK